MDSDDFLNLIIRPTTRMMGMHSKSSDMLMLGTALVETDLAYLEQKGAGNGLGPYSIESITHKDIARYLNRGDNRVLKEICLSTCFYVAIPPGDDALVHNLRYSTVIARLKYWMQKDPLPSWDDALGLANYHKKYFNSVLGKTDVKVSVKVFEKIINQYE